MFYLYLKVFHIIGVIVWFAGLFYLGRLFVYHREADERPEPESTTLKSQFSLMERRLYYGIAWPGLCISLVFGVALIIVSGFPGWLHAKLAFVLVLVVYHLWCGHLRKLLLKEKCSWDNMLGKKMEIKAIPYKDWYAKELKSVNETLQIFKK